MPRPPLSLVLTLVLAAAPPVAAQTPDDPFVWLEDVQGPRAMTWVEEHNAATLAELSREPFYRPIYDRVLAIFNSTDRIAFPAIMGEQLYNFWQDDRHQRGIWRRTTWESFLSGTPA